MGLMIHDLEQIPSDISRAYYIYLLDYGWKNPLSDIVMENFNMISDQASKNNAVFIKGTVGSHVDNQILSWHHIMGENADKILPAILVTTENPHSFRNVIDSDFIKFKSKLIIIPIKKVCKSNNDVINLIAKIFKDINNGVNITEFSMHKEISQNVGQRLVNGAILQPNFNGLGFDFKAFFGK